MNQIPLSAMLLGLGGVLPFAAPVLASLIGMEEPLGVGWVFYLLLYAMMILAFMSGCIWAFASQHGDPTGYALSTLPALYGAAILMLAVPLGITTPREAAVMLALGFVALLALDRRAFNRGQTPDWWLSLRLTLTTLVVVCLIVGAFA